MVAEPVQLHNPHGTRYTLEQREAAYQTWKIGSGRSLRRTAGLTGISQGTLGSWSREDGWQRRAREEDAEVAATLATTLRNVLGEEVVKSIEAARAVRDDDTGKVPPRDRLAAAQWLAGIAGISPQKPIELAPLIEEAWGVDAGPEDD